MRDRLSDSALDVIFRTARSFNGYTDHPVTLDDCQAIWDLMKWGPTSANQMPARLIWCTTDAAKAKLAACASGTNGPKIIAAPVTVIFGNDENFHDHLPTLFPHTDARSWFAHNLPLRQASAMRNGTLQGAYFIIAARALGFDTGPMSGFDNAAVDAAFFAETPHIKSNFIATLGVGDPSTVFDRLPRPDFATFNTVA